MLKKCFFALSLLAAAGYSHAAPSAEQVKAALYDRYAATQSGGADLKQALDKEVAVKDCRAVGDEYRCLVENKDLGSSIPMFFAYDKATNKWTFTKEEKN
ncbi:MAG TPA: hypothetical protein VEA17_11070 [Bordetella sp.]|nr:hypothetical protein [Bordetella sp.]